MIKGWEDNLVLWKGCKEFIDQKNIKRIGEQTDEMMWPNEIK